jgi:hypothetical protein
VSADGRRVSVRDQGRLVATVDARTFAVSEPGAAPVAPAEPRPATAPPADDGGLPWAAVLLAIGATALCAAAVTIARRRARGPLGRGGSLAG